MCFVQVKRFSTLVSWFFLSVKYKKFKYNETLLSSLKSSVGDTMIGTVRLTQVGLPL